MDGTKVFISSCSRRQMARRRSSRVSAVRMQLLRTQVLLVVLVLALGFGAFVAGHGGI